MKLEIFYLLICALSTLFNIDVIKFIYNRIIGWNKYDLHRKLLAIILTISFITFEIILLYLVLNAYHGIKIMKLINL